MTRFRYLCFLGSAFCIYLDMLSYVKYLVMLSKCTMSVNCLFCYLTLLGSVICMNLYCLFVKLICVCIYYILLSV
jgi:hypothetical protein